MKRREFIGLISAVAVMLPFPAYPQRSAKTYRIGYLNGGKEAAFREYLAAFKTGMRDLGYVEGQDFSIEARFADGNFEHLPFLVGELLSHDPDVLLVATTPANLAAKAATSTVPIVLVAVADPIGVGLISNLAHPGGNITGVTNIGAELAGKRLEILKEIVPAASKVAILINPNDPNARLQMDSAKPAAVKLAVQLDPVLEIRSADDLKGAFEAAVRAHADAALRMIDPLESTLREQTVALAAKHRLPIMYPFREAVGVGGLVSYGTELADQFRQAALFVHKILRGAQPADLPVEQPTKFVLAINLKTAKALGLSIPPTLLARADEVIE
jgi:putative tryptophan/tyrosine transport system substrate-binding protein